MAADTVGFIELLGTDGLAVAAVGVYAAAFTVRLAAFVVAAGFGAVLVVLASTDVERRVIPNRSSFPLP